MDEFVKVPRGKPLLQLLEERHWLPIGIIKYTCCASCVESFTPLRQPVAELRAAPDGLRIPILYVCPLCEVCATKYRLGGRRHRAVLAAIQEFLAKELPQ